MVAISPVTLDQVYFDLLLEESFAPKELDNIFHCLKWAINGRKSLQRISLRFKDSRMDQAPKTRNNHGTLPDDVIQNGICKPRAGTKTERMWKLIDALGSAANPPERFKVMEAMHGFNAKQTEGAEKFSAYSMALQYHQWRKFNGVAGDRAKLYRKRSSNTANGFGFKLDTQNQEVTKQANNTEKFDKNNSNRENHINLSELNLLYRNNEAARKLLDYLATRKNNMNQTTVARLVSALSRDGVTKPQVFETLRELAKLRCGELKIGRKGQVSRMLWKNVKIVSLGQAASGRGKVEDILLNDEEEEIEPRGLSEVEVGLMRTHHHHLRVDLVTEFSLPKDLTQREANRLADFIRTLPFGENHSDIA